MTTDQFDTEEFLRNLLAHGWRWSGTDPGLLVHPTDHDFAVRYDGPTERLTLSPELEAYIARVIPTPASRGRFWR